MALPNLTQSTISARSSSRSFQRGEAYLSDGVVENIVWRGDEDGILSAEVYGSDYEPYQIQIEFRKSEIVRADCSCPYHMGGDCKHIVATLLSVVHSPEEIDQRSAIPALIADLDKEQLSWLVRMLAELHPEIADSIETLVEQVTESPASESALDGADGDKDTAPVIPPINEKLLRRQIAADMRGAIDTGYDGWGEEAWYDSDLSVALEPALTQIGALIDAGQAKQALSVLQVATEAWDNGASRIDDYFYEYFADAGSQFLSGLNYAWTEAILLAELTPDERAEWAGQLDDWTETLFCGGDLEMAARAAHDGWDYPPLVAAMAGNITELGAWAEDDDPGYWAEDLAKIRLDILEQKGDLQSALHLAEAEGQYIRFLQLLIKLNQSERAISETKEMLDRPKDIQIVAETLFEAGKVDQAMALAQFGLGLKKSQTSDEYGSWGFDTSKAELAAWLRDAAQSHDPKLALDMAKQALLLLVNLPNYQRVQEVAGDQWAALKPEILAMIKTTRASAHKVDIYLHEGLHQDLIRTVDSLSYFSGIDKVLDAIQAEFPEWAFHECCKRAESTMDAGRAKYYQDAANWLRRGRDILRPAGREKLWASYIAEVMEKHQRKYKLMPMLREIA